MRFAICNETFVDWPHARAFAFARECGYTGIEIAPFTLAADIRSLSAAARTDIARAAAAEDLEVLGLHWLLAKTQGFHLTSPDPEVRRRTADYFKDLVTLCRDLGGHLLVLGSPLQRNLGAGVTTGQGMDYALDVIQRFLPALEQMEVTLAVEPLGPSEGNFLLTAAQAVELIERVGSPYCRLHLDCKAMSSESEAIPDLIRRHARSLVHFHANDPNRQGPGFGELDFVPILEALGEVGYRGWVSVEVFDYTPGSERLARESIDYLQGCLKRLAVRGPGAEMP